MIEPVEYRPSRARMVVVAAFLLVFGVGFVWALGEPKAKPADRPLFVVGLLGCAAGFVAALFPIVRPRAVLRLDAEGVTERGHFGAESLRLPWSNVLRVEPFRWRVVPMLALVPFDEERALADAPSTMRKAAQGNARLYGHAFVLDPRMYGRKVGEVQEEIERRLAAPPTASGAHPRPKAPLFGNVPRGS